MAVGAGSTDLMLDVAAQSCHRFSAGSNSPVFAACDGDVSWRAVSHLSLNYLSLVNASREEGAAALRELLALYAPSTNTRRRASWRNTCGDGRSGARRRLPGSGPLTFGRGLEIALVIDEMAFEGSSTYLLGSVLERYFARHVSLNSFTETVMRSEARGEMFRWVPLMGRETDTLTFLVALADAPYRFDFYQTMRRLECLYDERPRWGRALRPVDEPVRLGQDPDLAFPVSSLASFEQRDGRVPRLQVRLFGLFGPNGALPCHITEYARERLRHADDPTLCRFIDIIHHRFIALFYRAWAEAQPAVNRDRPRDDRFSTYVGAFVGLAPPSLRDRDSVPDMAKLFHAGALGRQVRNADGLAQILEHFFRVPVRIEQFVGHWMILARKDRTRLTTSSAILGSGAVLGGAGLGPPAQFRVHLGPLTMAHEGFLPGAALLRPLVDWIRQYFCFEFDWDVRLSLAQSAVPRPDAWQAASASAGRRGSGNTGGDRKWLISASTRKRMFRERTAPHERDQSRIVVRQVEQPRLQGD